jgi:hypothetical protein
MLLFESEEFAVSVQESICVRRFPVLQKVLVLLPLILSTSSPLLAAEESITTSSQARDIPSGQAPGVTPQALAPHRSSDVLTYWYGPAYHTPFVVNPATGKAADIARNSIEYMHAGTVGILSTFADVTMSQSNMAEPAANGGTGATELYAILRPGVSLNALTGSAIFRKVALRDITFEVGANLESKNSSYAPGERTLYIGPRLDFALPRGFFNVGLHARKEWNHEGVLGRSEDYDPDFNIEPTWMIPFALGKVRLAYSGFADYNTAKGKDSFGNETVGEFLVRNSLAIDIGAPLFHRDQLLELHGGFWYWHNEYGKPSSDPGAEQMTPIVGLAFHLDGGRTVRHH